MPRGMIETFCTWSCPGSAKASSAWPTSWCATRSRSMRFSTRLRFSRPATIRSTASCRSRSSTPSAPRRTASSAASFTTLARSAPTSPAVIAATTSSAPSSASLIWRACTRRIASRPPLSGRSTSTCRSKRPARRRAGSRISGRFVAAIRITPTRGSNPSISTSSWFRVCSRSSWASGPTPRAFPSASSSSMKTMHGARSRACRKRSRTRAAPTPTNISTNSEPLMLKKGTAASPATARASSVLPVPGGPTRRMPFGILPPSRRNLSGVFRNSMTSWSSCLASSTPATSAKVTLTSVST